MLLYAVWEVSALESFQSHPTKHSRGWIREAWGNPDANPEKVSFHSPSLPSAALHRPISAQG